MVANVLPSGSAELLKAIAAPRGETSAVKLLPGPPELEEGEELLALRTCQAVP